MEQEGSGAGNAVTVGSVVTNGNSERVLSPAVCETGGFQTSSSSTQLKLVRYERGDHRSDMNIPVVCRRITILATSVGSLSINQRTELLAVIANKLKRTND